MIGTEYSVRKRNAKKQRRAITSCLFAGGLDPINGPSAEEERRASDPRKGE